METMGPSAPRQHGFCRRISVVIVPGPSLFINVWGEGGCSTTPMGNVAAVALLVNSPRYSKGKKRKQPGSTVKKEVRSERPHKTTAANEQHTVDHSHTGGFCTACRRPTQGRDVFG